MFHLDGMPLMAHTLTVLLVMGLISMACISAFAKKQRLLGLGLLLLSVSGYLWAGYSSYVHLQFALSDLSPFLSRMFVPLLNLLQAAGWGCVLCSIFKSPKPA